MHLKVQKASLKAQACIMRLRQTNEVCRWHIAADLPDHAANATVLHNPQ